MVFKEWNWRMQNILTGNKCPILSDLSLKQKKKINKLFFFLGCCCELLHLSCSCFFFHELSLLQCLHLSRNNLLFILFISFTDDYRNKPKQSEIQGVSYILSKRGTEHVLFEGNTFTPNEKFSENRLARTWKCSWYYKHKCRARVATRFIGDKEYIRPSCLPHNHSNMFPVETNLNDH